MGATEPRATMTARDEVLMRGLSDWVPLQRAHYHVAAEHPGESLITTRRRVLALIRTLVSDGSAELGDLQGPDDRFVAWPGPLDESMHRIERVYVERFADESIWPWYAWLSLTATGEALARRIEMTQLG